MAKIKLNLPTGVSVEKTLLSCFKADNNTYIIFDADSVGSMGLPIILVCKFENDRVIKIENLDEWNRVKGYLKEIISGVNKEYLNLNSTLDADEIFYTQLTLPLASFDILKNTYKVDANNIDNANSQSDVIMNLPGDINDESVISANTDAANSPVLPLTGDVIESNVSAPNANQMSNVDNEPTQLVENDISNDLIQAQNVVSAGSEVAVANPLISDNIMPSLDFQNNTVSNDISIQNVNSGVNLENEQSVIPVVSEEPMLSNPEPENKDNHFESDYSADKEAFLKACGNMFDALVSKFQTKNNNSNNN